MPFTFRYQTVLEHRRHVEEQRQRELTICVREQTRLENQLRQAQNTIRDNKAELAQSLVGKVETHQIAMIGQYANHMTANGMVIVRKIAIAQQQANEARARLLEATKQVKALELLRDRDQAQYKKAQAKKEASELDEIAIQQHARTAATVSTTD